MCCAGPWLSLGSHPAGHVEVSPQFGGVSVSPNQEDAAWFGCAVAQWDGQQEEGIGFVPSLGPTNTTCFRVCSTNSPCGSEITVPALAAAFWPWSSWHWNEIQVCTGPWAAFPPSWHSWPLDLPAPTHPKGLVRRELSWWPDGRGWKWMSPNSSHSLFNNLLTWIEASVINRLFSRNIRFEGCILCTRILSVHKYGEFRREKSLRRICAEVNFISDGEFSFWIDSQGPTSHMFPAESGEATPGAPA